MRLFPLGVEIQTNKTEIHVRNGTKPKRCKSANRKYKSPGPPEGTSSRVVLSKQKICMIVALSLILEL